MNSCSIKNVFDIVEYSSIGDVVPNLFERKEALAARFNEIPKRATEQSAGYDLSVLTDVIIQAHSTEFISFGHVITVAPGCTAFVLPRSSLAKKKGLVMVNGPFCVDDFGLNPNGVLILPFTNYTDEDVTVHCGEKIAQVVFIKSTFMKSRISSAVYGPGIPIVINNNFEFVDLNEVIPVANGNVNFYFQCHGEVYLEPGKVTPVMTGIKCKMELNQVLLIKSIVQNPVVELANCIGVIDADYYGNSDNDGEIGVLLLNRGVNGIKLNFGETIAVGSIFEYVTIDDDVSGGQRVGGFGSTDK